MRKICSFSEEEFFFVLKTPDKMQDLIMILPPFSVFHGQYVFCQLVETVERAKFHVLLEALPLSTAQGCVDRRREHLPVALLLGAVKLEQRLKLLVSVLTKR